MAHSLKAEQTEALPLGTLPPEACGVWSWYSWGGTPNKWNGKITADETYSGLRGIPIGVGWDQLEPEDEAQLLRYSRGGNIYLTVWGPEPSASVEIEIDAEKLGLKEIPTFTEIVGDTPMKVTPSANGWKLTVPMEKNMTRVIKIN